MASTLPKLFRRSVDARSIASLLYAQYPKFIPPLTIRPQIHLETETSNCDTSISWGQKADELTRLQSLLFCPSYPFGFYLNPIWSNGFIESEGNYDVPSYSETVWADSVKKKRRKKINKHKYLKLRKRLRRQTEPLKRNARIGMHSTLPPNHGELMRSSPKISAADNEHVSPAYLNSNK